MSLPEVAGVVNAALRPHGLSKSSEVVLISDSANAFQKCAECGATDKKLLRCGRCKNAWYCSLECQRKNWKTGHKDRCSISEQGSVVRVQTSEELKARMEDALKLKEELCTLFLSSANDIIFNRVHVSARTDVIAEFEGESNGPYLQSMHHWMREATSNLADRLFSDSCGLIHVGCMGSMWADLELTGTRRDGVSVTKKTWVYIYGERSTQKGGPTEFYLQLDTTRHEPHRGVSF